ncbi:MAG: type II secretion system protein [Ruminococcaceae bacterium]|nr:type II secretion system protein [Oscillospiraceae bacterium]
MKRLLKQKRGMTLMEILVALSLLLIIIVGTTPVMLQAYNGLYTAGEKTQETYEAKSDIEEMLATRNTRNVYPDFVVNFKNLGEVASLNGRRAVSSLYGSLETLFTNARVRVAIISSKTVNDDYSMNGKIWTQGTDNTAGAGWHEVVIQTTNLDFGTTNKNEAQAHLSINTTDNIADGGKIVDGYEKYIDITFIIPNKSTDVLERIYTYHGQEAKLANVDYSDIKVDPITGRITVKINGFDFTQSPIKLYVAYLDENKKRQTTEAYLEVDTPTIIAAGETGTYDYYTSPGFVQKTKSTVDASGNVIDKNVTESFGFYGRTMRTDNATGTQAIPDGTIFKSANWITETTKSGELVGNVYAPSYYVLTGTNGAIYRTYSFVKTGSVAGKVKLNTTDAQFNGIDQTAMADVIGVTDEAYILDDRASTRVYPAVWGGDFSHIFGYSTYDKSVGYIDRDGKDIQCWYTEDGNSGKGQAGYYSNIAKFGYYYNAFGLTFSAKTQRSKKISYILTERENALRVGGIMADPGNYDFGPNRIWERPQKLENGQYASQKETKNAKDAMETWYYHMSTENHARSAISKLNEEGKNYTDAGVSLNQLPTYFADEGSSSDLDRRSDNGFAQVRLQTLTTLSQRFFVEREAYHGTNDSQLSDVKFVYNNQENRSKINITGAVYIPATSTTTGGMFYVGTVAAHSLIYQTDNVASGANDAARIWNNGSDNTGFVTTYWLMSNDEGTATTAYKMMPSAKGTTGLDFSIMNDDVLPRLVDGVNTIFPADEEYSYNVEIKSAKINTDDSREFFITRTPSEKNKYGEKYALFNDLLFTMGYASNREMVYSKIVYGNVDGVGLQEAYKSYEPFYYLSHYGDEDHFANGYFNQTQYTKIAYDKKSRDNGNVSNDSKNTQYLNSPDNDYYNVWFPGEMYNLTHVVTKEGVTVSVGYAVSGSTYTYINPDESTNSSTALSGIHNDGVLATMVLGSDTSFTNLLYFKETENFDRTSLSNGEISYYTGEKEYDKLWGKDGTNIGSNSRDSVQFTAVDIGIQYTKVSDTSEKATYYAYYADNKGRVFRSKVATRNSSATVAGTPTKVNYVSDIIVSTGDSRLASDTVGYMEQLTLPGSKQFVDIFDSITSLVVEGNMIFISGKPNQANAAEINAKGVPTVVGLIDEATGNIEWIINYSSSTVAADCWVEDLLVLDGYLYIAGRYVGTATSDRGFVAGVSVADLRSILMSRTTSIEHTVSLKCVNLPDAIYAIDGHK